MLADCGAKAVSLMTILLAVLVQIQFDIVGMIKGKSLVHQSRSLFFTHVIRDACSKVTAFQPDSELAHTFIATSFFAIPISHLAIFPVHAAAYILPGENSGNGEIP